MHKLILAYEEASYIFFFLFYSLKSASENVLPHPLQNTIKIYSGKNENIDKGQKPPNIKIYNGILVIMQLI